MDSKKVVLVTGGSSGIGEATAIEYAKLGYQVAITGRTAERLQKVTESLKVILAESDLLVLSADFEDPAQVEPVVSQTIAKFGRLDILINNAGYLGKSLNMNNADFFEDFTNIIQVNLMAATRLVQLALPHIIKTKGVVVNVSSVGDQLAMATTSYSVSKAGLSMLSKCLSNALDGTGARAVTVSPGPIATNLTGKPLEEQKEDAMKYAMLTNAHRLGQSKEVADTIVFLTSDKASYITGCTIHVDGGLLNKFAGVTGMSGKASSG